jgi:hypothetical protein
MYVNTDLSFRMKDHSAGFGTVPQTGGCRTSSGLFPRSLLISGFRYSVFLTKIIIIQKAVVNKHLYDEDDGKRLHHWFC